MYTREVFLFAMLVAGPLPGALAVEGPLATRPQAFRPVTLEAGRPKFHIPPNCRLARNEHPRFLLTKEDLDVLRARLTDARFAAEFRAIHSGYCSKRLVQCPAVRSTRGWISVPENATYGDDRREQRQSNGVHETFLL